MTLADTDTVADLLTDAPTAETIPVRQFSLHDRCDRCGFQSYYVAQKKDKPELVFCKHHGERHIVALTIEGWTVYDFTAELNEKRTLEASSSE